MNMLRKHWFDLGGFFAVLLLLFVLLQQNNLTSYQLLMCFSLASLFLHQLEEYRLSGTFPGMINSVVYNSKSPNRYPLNSNTAFYINVFVGWGTYSLAAAFAEKAIWLGVAAIMVSLGNVTAHTFVFNIKGKTFYNAGLLTCWLFFVPCILFFFKLIFQQELWRPIDLLIGIPLGIALNFLGVLKMIDWMADENSPYVFSQRQLLAKDRNKKSNSKV